MGDPSSACVECPLPENYDKFACMTVSMDHEDKCYGFFSTSISRDFVGIEEEQVLFKEISQDIALALHGIEQEKKRKQAETLFQELFETISSGVAIFEVVEDAKDFVFKGFNRAGEKIEGVKREDIIGQKVTEAFPDIEEFGLLDVLRRVWKTGQPEYHPMSLYKDMRIVSWRENRIFKLLSGEVVVVYEDVTEHKSIEEEKAKLEDQLRQSQKMEAIGRLAGGVAHDFNNLLTGINGYSEMIINSLMHDDPLRADIEEIRKAGLRAADLTAQLLAFSRKQIIAPKVIRPNEILEYSQKMLKRIIGEDIDFVFKPAEKLWRIKADPAQLDQIFVNLAVNARDAMPDGGKLTIETQNVDLDEQFCISRIEVEPGEYVMLAVSDTGQGMDGETKSKIFEPFYSTKEIGKGTGLGLSTVYGIMRQNKGFINVYSERGQGTTFKIYFPAVMREADELEEGQAFDLPTGTETILLVEDEDMVRGLAKKALSRQGYKVIEALDGGKAYLICMKHPGKIDLLVTDVIMPTMNGLELQQRLLEVKPDLKALFMSGYTENVIAQHGILDEGMHFIQKPFTIEALAKAVRNTLDS